MQQNHSAHIISCNTSGQRHLFQETTESYGQLTVEGVGFRQSFFAVMPKQDGVIPDQFHQPGLQVVWIWSQQSIAQRIFPGIAVTAR